MKTYIIKTTWRIGNEERINFSKEYKSLAIAKRFLGGQFEQTIIERTHWIGKDHKRYYADIELV